MKSIDQVKAFFRDAAIDTNPNADESVLADALEAGGLTHRNQRVSATPRIWRFFMKQKMTRLAVAAVVVATALAIGVEVFRPRNVEQPSAFSARLAANTALDLDPKGAIPLRQVRPEDFDVTWDAENGGTLRIMPDSGLRLMSPEWSEPEWKDVIPWAHQVVAELLESPSTSVVAAECRFAAILTSEGNLAIVEIGDYDEDEAQLQWRVESTEQPGFGSAQAVTLTCADPEHPSSQPCAIDFDSGRTIAVAPRILNLPADEFMAWLGENGIDAIAVMDDTEGGLVGVGLAHEPVGLGIWTVIPAQAALDIVGSVNYQSRDPILFKEDQYQVVHAFKTQEGGIGILQMQGADRSERTVRFRFKMVRPEASATMSTTTAEDDAALPLYVSGWWMSDLGKSMLIYANQHEDRLPLSMEDVLGDAKNDENRQWMLNDVAYLGAGLTCDDPVETVVAYDKALLAAGKGTNVLFLDSHVEYADPARLAELGLPTSLEEGSTTADR